MLYIPFGFAFIVYMFCFFHTEHRNGKLFKAELKFSFTQGWVNISSCWRMVALVCCEYPVKNYF